MNKQEFMEQLRRSLASINDYAFVNDTVAYYENYIESQIRMGKTEAEVMQELGDPRLIAKSIHATRTDDADGQGTNEYESYREHTTGSKMAKTLLNLNGRQINLPSWLIKILTILIVFVVLWLIFTILSWLAPFIILGIVAYSVYKLILNILK